MKKRHVVLPALGATLLAASGIALAATTSLESLRVGTAGEGGVTFFNGSIVNEEGPLVVADDLRVDGRITRLDGQEDKPVIVNDDLEVDGDVMADNLYTKTQADGRYVSMETPTWEEKTGYISVHAAGFTPDNDNADYSRSDNGITMVTEAETPFYGQVSLPDGAVVTKVEARVVDNDNGSDVSVALKSRDMTAGTTETHASASTSGQLSAEQTITDTSITSATVDNNTNAYFVEATLTGDLGTHRLVGVDITYTFTEPY